MPKPKDLEGSVRTLHGELLKKPQQEKIAVLLRYGNGTARLFEADIGKGASNSGGNGYSVHRISKWYLGGEKTEKAFRDYLQNPDYNMLLVNIPEGSRLSEKKVLEEAIGLYVEGHRQYLEQHAVKFIMPLTEEQNSTFLKSISKGTTPFNFIDENGDTSFCWMKPYGSEGIGITKLFGFQ